MLELIVNTVGGAATRPACVVAPGDPHQGVTDDSTSHPARLFGASDGHGVPVPDRREEWTFSHHAAQAASLAARVFGSSNPATAFAALAPEQQAAVRLAETPAGPPLSTVTAATSSGAPVASAGGCWGMIRTVFQNNTFGQRLWTYNQQLNWCSNGGTLTSNSAKKYPSEKMAGWTYTEIGGPTPQLQRGGVGNGLVEVWAQGQFQLFAVGICVQTYYP
jgi:hypothetical protein